MHEVVRGELSANAHADVKKTARLIFRRTISGVKSMQGFYNTNDPAACTRMRKNISPN